MRPIGQHRRRRRGLLALVAVGLSIGLVATITVGIVHARRERPTSASPGDGGSAYTPVDGTPIPSPPANRGSGRAAARTCAGHQTEAARELRGVWLTTVNNIDFPSKRGLSEAKVKEEYLAWLDLFQRLNFNAIFVH